MQKTKICSFPRLKVQQKFWAGRRRPFLFCFASEFECVAQLVWNHVSKFHIQTPKNGCDIAILSRSGPLARPSSYDDATMILWWCFDDVMMMLWWCYDVTMMLWWCYDGVMMLWWCYDDVMMMLWWWGYDDVMVMFWWYYDDAMMALYGDVMIYPLLHNRTFKRCSSLAHERFSLYT